MIQDKKNKVEKGICPICSRVMYEGNSINKHHLVPKSRGGVSTEYLHRICHAMIHSLWSEKELAQHYDSAEKIIASPRMQKFIAWVQKKDPLYYERTISSREKNRKR